MMTGLHHARDPQAAEIAAAAARLTGTPDQLAERLRALLDEAAPKAPARETTDQRADRMAAEKRHERAIAVLRHRLASDFADDRGLQLTAAPLAVRELARRAPPGGHWHRTPREWFGSLLHPAFFRDADKRCAAMVAHPLAQQVETKPGEIEAWAAEQGLRASFPTWPSWQYPGRTVLVMLEPAEPLAPYDPIAKRRAAAAAPPIAQASASGDVERRDIGQPVGNPDTLAADVTGHSGASDPVVFHGHDDHGERPDGVEGAPGPDQVEPAPPTAPDLPSMRPIAPIDLAGAVPRDLAGELGPDFDLVAPAELLVDEQYQRNLSPKSLDLIRRIVAGWSWSKFKPPICTRVEGTLHVIDGQHTAIAAASHGGIPIIPVVVVAVPEVADRAAAFVSHAKDRLQATALQVHRAALVAGDPEAVTLAAVCRRAGVEMMPFAPSDGRYEPRQTVAVVGLRRLIAKRGPDRAAEILSALAAAHLAPISGDQIRLGEALLCDPAYADTFDADRLTAAMRGLSAKTHAEARELAIAQRLPAWRALAAVMARNSRTAAPRRRASA